MTVPRPRKAVVAAVAVAALTVPTAAYAHSTIFRAPPEPLAAGNGFTALPPHPPQTFKACGTTITLRSATERVFVRTTETPSLIVDEYKGTALIRVTAADGRRIPQLLDASGPATVMIQESKDPAKPGATITAEFRGASVLLPQDEVTNNMHRRAGLPFFTIVNGTLLMQDTFTGPREKAVHTSARVLRRPAKVVDGCTLLRPVKR